MKLPNTNLSPIEFQERQLLEGRMALVCWMYYEQGYTQNEIAEKLHTSRVMIVRLLQRAKNEGIVQFKIAKSLPEERNLEMRLHSEFNLDQVIVVRSKTTTDNTLEDMGFRTAEILQEKLFPGCRLGVGWSTTILRVVSYLKQVTFDMSVNDLSGTFIGKTNPYSAAWEIAQKLGANTETIPAPVLIRNSAAYQGLLQETSIHDALENAKKCDVIVFGIGNLNSGAFASPTGYFKEDVFSCLHEKGAVGDILMRPFDINGKYLSYPLDDQVISLSINDILKIPYRIAVAASESKAKAILGALRSEIIDVLVTDNITAKKILFYLEN